MLALIPQLIAAGGAIGGGLLGFIGDREEAKEKLQTSEEFQAMQRLALLRTQRQALQRRNEILSDPLVQQSRGFSMSFFNDLEDSGPLPSGGVSIDGRTSKLQAGGATDPSRRTRQTSKLSVPLPSGPFGVLQSGSAQNAMQRGTGGFPAAPRRPNPLGILERDFTNQLQQAQINSGLRRSPAAAAQEAAGRVALRSRVRRQMLPGAQQAAMMPEQLRRSIFNDELSYNLGAFTGTPIPGISEVPMRQPDPTMEALSGLIQGGGAGFQLGTGIGGLSF